MKGVGRINPSNPDLQSLPTDRSDLAGRSTSAGRGSDINSSNPGFQPLPEGKRPLQGRASIKTGDQSSSADQAFKLASNRNNKNK